MGWLGAAIVAHMTVVQVEPLKGAAMRLHKYGDYEGSS
jgi:hypothetical protein